MRNCLYLLIILTVLLTTSCSKEAADLPIPDAVMVKFVNATDKNIQELIVSRADVGTLEKGKTTGEYFRFDQLGQQFGYALVEAVGTINGKRFYTASACQGVCDTPSAPHGVWLEPDYYKISIHIAYDEGNYLEFRMMEP